MREMVFAYATLWFAMVAAYFLCAVMERIRPTLVNLVLIIHAAFALAAGWTFVVLPLCEVMA